MKEGTTISFPFSTNDMAVTLVDSTKLTMTWSATSSLDLAEGGVTFSCGEEGGVKGVLEVCVLILFSSYLASILPISAAVQRFRCWYPLLVRYKTSVHYYYTF